MSITQFRLNTQAKESDGFTPFVKNYYPVLTEEIDERANSKGTGRFVSVKLRVTEGPYKGRVVFDNINYIHENEEAQAQGENKLSLLMMATGVTSFKSEADINKLCDKFIEAKIETVKKKGEENHVVWSYRARQGIAQTAQASQPSRPQRQQAAPSPAIEDDDIPF